MSSRARRCSDHRRQRPASDRPDLIDGTPESPIDWTLNDPVEINAGGGWFASKINKDGRFRIEDVPAGKCILSFPSMPTLMRGGAEGAGSSAK